MTFTFYDIALPLGLGAMFGIYRYTGHVKTSPENAVAVSIGDALKGALGLFVIHNAYKLASLT